MRKHKEVIIILAILGLPVLFFVILKTGHTNFVKLPIYGERVYDEQLKDTVYHTLPDFKLIDQTGALISLKDFDTSIIIANFFFASCQDVCPVLNKNLEVVYHKTKEVPNVKFLSHTVDPDHDSVPVLAAYAKRFHADASRWHFVTGSKQDLYDIAMKGYLVPVTKEDTTIDHSQNLILIDPWRRIRGYYDGLNEEDVKKLMDEIKVLQVEIYERSKNNAR